MFQQDSIVAGSIGRGGFGLRVLTSPSATYLGLPTLANGTSVSARFYGKW
jgi:hypothetical protein